MRRGALLLVLLLAGCGTGGLGRRRVSGANGEELFKEKCAGCHELKAAGARGTIGPSLDAAFAASREEGFDESTIREVVLGQMRFPIAPMPAPDELFPANEFSEAERDAAMESIASYVASVAANQQAIAQAGQQGGQRLGGRPEGALHLELRRVPHVRGGRGQRERSGRTSTRSRSPQTGSPSRSERAAAACRPSKAS